MQVEVKDFDGGSRLDEVVLTGVMKVHFSKGIRQQLHIAQLKDNLLSGPDRVIRAKEKGRAAQIGDEIGINGLPAATATRDRIILGIGTYVGLFPYAVSKPLQAKSTGFLSKSYYLLSS